MVRIIVCINKHTTLHPNVTSSMPACNFWCSENFISLLKIIHYQYFSYITFYSIIRTTHFYCMSLCLVIRSFLQVRNIFPGFDPPFHSIECNLPALIGGISSKRIIYRYTVCINDLCTHFIENINFITPYTTISYISVMLFILYIKINQALIFINIPIEFALVFMLTTTAFCTAERIIFPIMLQ